MEKDRRQLMAWISGRTGMVSPVFLLLLAAGVFFVVMVREQQSIPMPDESLVELSVEHEGTAYKLVNGDLYQVASPDRLVFVEKIYDKDFRKTNYASQDGQVFRVDTDTGKRYPTRRHFEDGFENADQITDLIGEQRGWTSFTLQSSSTPSVPEYVQLRSRILRGEAEFMDNRVEPSSENVRTGARALKCYSLAPTPQMIFQGVSLHGTTLLRQGR